MPCAPISARIGAPSSSAFARDITTTAAAPSEICDADPAVTVPSAENAGRSLASDAAVVPSPHTLVVGDRDRVTAALRHRHVDDLVVEQTRSCARSAARSWDWRGVGVLVLAGELPLLAVELGGVTHAAQVERAVQGVVRGRVDDLVVAVAVAGAGAGQQVRAVGHRLHAARDDDVELAGADQLVGHRDRVQPRQAHLVDGQGGHVHRDAALDRGLPGGDLPGAGLDHMTHDHVVDLVAGDPRALQRRGDGEPAEVHRGEPLERTRQLPDGRAGTPDDHRTWHEQPPVSASRWRVRFPRGAHFFFLGM